LEQIFQFITCRKRGFKIKTVRAKLQVFAAASREPLR
jgi:hypothetical protein